MVEESNQNVFLIQRDASSFAEFEISEFEIARVDCNSVIKYNAYFSNTVHVLNLSKLVKLP